MEKHQNGTPHCFSDVHFFLNHLSPFPFICAAQACSCCNGATEAAAVAAAVEEEQANLDLGETEALEEGCQRRPREEPSNSLSETTS